MKPYSFEPNFMTAEESVYVFTLLTNTLAWVDRGAPRREYWTNSLNRPYTYGRGAGIRTYEAQPENETITMVTDALEKTLGFRYEGCFLNFYKDERDALGWHSDDDPGINHTRPIAVVTVGAARDIMIRPSAWEENRGKDDLPDRITLTPGSLLLMNPGMQQTHQHRIPKGSRACGPRISLTYRSLL